MFGSKKEKFITHISFKAGEARELARRPRLLGAIESKIKELATAGEIEYNYSGALTDPVIVELENAGYTVTPDEQRNKVLIRWGY